MMPRQNAVHDYLLNNLRELKYWYDKGDAAGQVTRILTNTTFSMPDADITIEATFWLRGDVNDDGKVDVTDVNEIVNMVLGKTAKRPIADLNGDGEIDVSDINIDVNIVLGKEKRQGISSLRPH